ncbi:WD40 repeat-like protein [Fomitiporia mediterranea MF3/22]|uniref:WD40 repeat-like protein n=1 Tax=Fomitiporia mediterranea (strain MF3/22) TaxID=694068 RepID=UPI0004409C64|nr:WD40 repeat-like protein [Fomitiporia mediterranea MF3/22]EJD04371.1 WD40 repeat-like protein [Fomitiporia mediterranea MF3/22]
MPTTISYGSQAEAQPSNARAYAVHRCRFVDYNPAAITAVAFPPLALPNPRDSRRKNTQRIRKGRFGTLAVGRANGNIELYEWAIPPQEQEHTLKAPQAWVLSKILYGPNPSKVDSLVFVLRHPHLLAYNEVPSRTDLRLFSAGGGSELVEWDTASGTILRTLNSQGGAIWSIAANQASTRLAVGCEDGCIRLIDVADNELMHLRRFDRVKCRILSIAWGPPIPPSVPQRTEGSQALDNDDEDEDVKWTDSWLVTGGSDSSLRKWDAKTGRVLDRMSTDKVRGDRTLVWAVGVLADGTIISGDSLGVVKFWDARSCTQLHSFTAHGADVLCMAIGPDGKSVFTSGVDQKVCLFTHIKISNTDRTEKESLRSSTRWVHSTSKRMHSHDVRALAVWPPYLPISTSVRPAATSSSPFSGIAPILASGGLDASLVLAPCATASTNVQQVVNPLATSAISTFEDAYHRRLAYPTGISPSVRVARTGRLIVCSRGTGVSVWRIVGQARLPSALEADLRAAQAMDVDGPSSGAGAMKQEEDECGYEKLLDMELDVVTNICSCAISDDGHWLVVSDTYEIKLFELLVASGDGRIKPRRIKSFMPMLAGYLSSSSVSSKEPEGASALGFTPDSGRLVLALARTARVLVVDLTGRSTEGRPEPRVLRKFDHHARRGALFAHGRVVKGMPGRANGIPHARDDDSDSSHNDEGSTRNTAENSDVNMDVENAKDGKEGTSSDESDGETEGERAFIIRIAFSPDGQWLATTDSQYRTHIFNLDSVQHHTVLPTSPSRVTALAFSPATLLILAHSDSTIGVFDVEAKRFAPWASHLALREHLPRRWTSLHDSVLGIVIEPPSPSLDSSPTSKSDNVIDNRRHALFWGSTWLCRVALDAPVGWGGFLKKRPHDLNLENENETMSNFKLISRYRPILCVDFLSPGELLVVERPLLDILRGLPPAFFKPKYGT